jgi:hypothetical protein
VHHEPSGLPPGEKLYNLTISARTKQEKPTPITTNTNTMCCLNDPNQSLPVVEPIRIDADAILLKRTVPVTVVRTRRVSFEKSEHVLTVAASSTMTEEERSGLWYQQSDLNQFKNEAKGECRRIRDDLLDRDILLDFELAHCSHMIECTRGLEHRVSIERQKNKYLSIRAIIKAQQRYSKPEQLAHVSLKCTAWSKELALVTGSQDFYQAYNPSLAQLVPFTPTVKFPMISKKRAESEAGSESESLDAERGPAFKRLRTYSPIPIGRTTAATRAEPTVSVQ